MVDHIVMYYCISKSIKSSEYHSTTNWVSLDTYKITIGKKKRLKRSNQNDEKVLINLKSYRTLTRVTI